MSTRLASLFTAKGRIIPPLPLQDSNDDRDAKWRYWMPAASVSLNDDDDLSRAWVVMVKRRKPGAFREEARWQALDIREDGTNTQSVLSTGNSHYGNVAVGFANYPKANGGVRQADFVFKGDWLDPGLVA